MLEVLSEFSHSALSSGVEAPGKRVDVANAQGEAEREGYSFYHIGRTTSEKCLFELKTEILNAKFRFQF